MRFWNWPELLEEYLFERRSMPFSWGKSANDCCSFGNGWVERATGFSPMADIADYTNETEAQAVLEGTSIETLIDARLQRRESPSFAQRGDIGLVTFGERATVVIVLGNEIVAPDLDGTRRLSRKLMQTAWIV